MDRVTKMWDENRPHYMETARRESQANSDSRVHSKTTLYVQLINHGEVIQGRITGICHQHGSCPGSLSHMKPASNPNPLRFTVPDFTQVWKYQLPASKYARTVLKYISTCDSALIFKNRQFRFEYCLSNLANNVDRHIFSLFVLPPSITVSE
jgi:hypothetical protein